MVEQQYLIAPCELFGFDQIGYGVDIGLRLCVQRDVTNDDQWAAGGSKVLPLGSWPFRETVQQILHVGRCDHPRWAVQETILVHSRDLVQ